MSFQRRFTLCKKNNGSIEFSSCIAARGKKYRPIAPKKNEALITGFENKYKMTFPQFEEACRDGRIKNPYSYEVEKDDWEWETAIEDHKLLDEIYRWLISVEENLST